MPQRIAQAYRAACLAELAALKPGNVHRFADGHRMTVADFAASAEASAPTLAAAGAGVGERVLRSVEATRQAVGMNTNLGILLLAAPLAAAAEAAASLGGGGGDEAAAESSLRGALTSVLGALTPTDAERTFRAIALAAPGGLGTHALHDVRDPPRIGLREAMAIAAPRDRVAAQYADGFRAVFGIGLPALRRARAEGETGMWPAVHCFLALASAFPDSHVERKLGAPVAEALRMRIGQAAFRSAAAGTGEDREAMLLDLDGRLKAEGLNPGTSADLTVASLFADGLARLLEHPGSG